jgi:hypothetical protein
MAKPPVFIERPPLKNPSPDGYESWPLASGAGAGAGAGGGASSARVSCSAIGAPAEPFCCRARHLVSGKTTELVKIKKETPYCKKNLNI